MTKLHFIDLDPTLAKGLCEMLPNVNFELDDNGTPVRATEGDTLSVKSDENGISITYPSRSCFYRALSFLGDDGEISVCESKKYADMLCYMADMSRNAVYNIPSAKRMIRYLALMGFNSLMLYTEDTYELPEYPYFGQMRGRFTKDELKEIDDYADMLGIEVIPCVQALAHLSTALRWPGYNKYSDTGDILLVGDDRTYELIDCILRTCRECFRSDRINLGMDEAFMLGRGAYLTKNGYRPPHELMLEHLDRVVALCDKYDYKPMIWSDMFFRMAFNGTYRVAEGEIAPEIIAKVPKNLTLIYWDYYSLSEDIFTHMLDCHNKFNNPTAFAGGAWKWCGFAPHNRFSLVSSRMQLDLCRKHSMQNMIVTGWGDNGGEASQFTPLPILLYFAENAFDQPLDNEWLEKRANQCFRIGFEDLLALDTPNELKNVPSDAKRPLNPSRYLVYNDPLEGLLDANMYPETDPAEFKEKADLLRKYTSHKDFGYMYKTLVSLCDYLSVKCDVSWRARRAYLDGDKAALSAVASDIPEMVAKLDDFIKTFRDQWYYENKTFGFSNQEIRLGGIKERLLSAKLRIEGYLDGKYERIEELEQPCLSIAGHDGYICNQSWIHGATVGVM